MTDQSICYTFQLHGMVRNWNLHINKWTWLVTPSTWIHEILETGSIPYTKHQPQEQADKTVWCLSLTKFVTVLNTSFSPNTEVEISGLSIQNKFIFLLLFEKVWSHSKSTSLAKWNFLTPTPPPAPRHNLSFFAEPPSSLCHSIESDKQCHEKRGVSSI